MRKTLIFLAWLLHSQASFAVFTLGEQKETSTKVIPLPVYSTLPNEGNTFGFMPVFLVVERENQRTQSIFAPSISWNSSIRYTATFRWYHYPDSDTVFTMVPSVSSNVNRRLTLEWARVPRKQGTWTWDLAFHYRRDIFERFFGIGQDTKSGDETSFTRGGGDFLARHGYNLSDHFNIGLLATAERDLVERIGVSGLPLTADAFPNVPGMTGSTTAMQGVSMRFDSRAERQYSESGLAVDSLIALGENLRNSDTFGRFELDTRVLIPQFSFTSGAFRGLWTYTAARSDIPFFKQSMLGGERRLRGFTLNRFTNKGAWTVEYEQRTRVHQTHIYGVTADWRIDPFVTMGQVYGGWEDIADHVRVAGGLGFRAFVKPNVLGRVDVAVAGEGPKVYVELGYPF